MADEAKKPYLLIVVIGIIVVALLASVDLSGVWKSDKEPVRDHTAHDAIFPFKWDYKVCDEVWIDSTGARVKVVNFDYDTWECTKQNEHHDCEVWHRKNYTHPKLAYMKGWKNVEEESDIKLSYSYDTTGNKLRVIQEEEWHGRTLIYDRAIKYDGHKIAAMLTQYFTVKDGKVEDTLSLRIDKYKYKDGKVDSVFVKMIDANREMAEGAGSCENENPLECYTGPNAAFNPYSASELVYEHLHKGEEEPNLFEKFDTTDSTMRVLKYCHDEDFSFEIREALPKSNYPLEEK
jgi:hypothetical protein